MAQVEVRIPAFTLEVIADAENEDEAISFLVKSKEFAQKCQDRCIEEFEVVSGYYNKDEPEEDNEEEETTP